MRLTMKGLGKAAFRLPEDTDETFNQRDLECRQFMKLRDLEDIEETLGIEFTLLDRISREGIWVSKKAFYLMPIVCKKWKPLKLEHIENSDIKIELFGVYKEKRIALSIMACVDYSYYGLDIKGYGKTWAVTKEELE